MGQSGCRFLAVHPIGAWSCTALGDPAIGAGTASFPSHCQMRPVAASGGQPRPNRKNEVSSLLRTGVDSGGQMRPVAAKLAGTECALRRPVRELFSYQEAAQVLGVSERTIRRLVREGLLPVVQLGSRVRRIDPDDLAAVIDRAKTRFPQ